MAPCTILLATCSCWDPLFNNNDLSPQDLQILHVVVSRTSHAVCQPERCCRMLTVTRLACMGRSEEVCGCTCHRVQRWLVGVRVSFI